MFCSFQWFCMFWNGPTKYSVNVYSAKRERGEREGGAECQKWYHCKEFQKHPKTAISVARFRLVTSTPIACPCPVTLHGLSRHLQTHKLLSHCWGSTFVYKCHLPRWIATLRLKLCNNRGLSASQTHSDLKCWPFDPTPHKGGPWSHICVDLSSFHQHASFKGTLHCTHLALEYTGNLYHINHNICTDVIAILGQSYKWR